MKKLMLALACLVVAGLATTQAEAARHGRRACATCPKKEKSCKTGRCKTGHCHKQKKCCNPKVCKADCPVRLVEERCVQVEPARTITIPAKHKKIICETTVNKECCEREEDCTAEEAARIGNGQRYEVTK